MVQIFRWYNSLRSAYNAFKVATTTAATPTTNAASVVTTTKAASSTATTTASSALTEGLIPNWVIQFALDYGVPQLKFTLNVKNVCTATTPSNTNCKEVCCETDSSISLAVDSNLINLVYVSI